MHQHNLTLLNIANMYLLRSRLYMCFRIHQYIHQSNYQQQNMLNKCQNKFPNKFPNKFQQLNMSSKYQNMSRNS